MAGEYRMESVLARLPEQLARSLREGLRIGLTNQPTTGCKICKDLANDMADAYEKIGETEYANGLRSGTMVPLTPLSGPDKYWAPGELFFKT